MQISEAMVKKAEMETKILSLIRDFQLDTGLSLEEVYLLHENRITDRLIRSVVEVKVNVRL